MFPPDDEFDLQSIDSTRKKVYRSFDAALSEAWADLNTILTDFGKDQWEEGYRAGKYYSQKHPNA